MINDVCMNKKETSLFMYRCIYHRDSHPLGGDDQHHDALRARQIRTMECTIDSTTLDAYRHPPIDDVEYFDWVINLLFYENRRKYPDHWQATLIRKTFEIKTTLIIYCNLTAVCSK